MQDQYRIDFTKTLGHKFRMVHVAIDKAFHHLAESEETLPRGQGPVIGYLMEHEDQVICQKDIEQVFHITGATVSNMLKSLEKHEMIRRIPMEEDARLKRILPTEKGIEGEIRHRKEILGLEKAMVKGFTPEEEAQFRVYLDRVNQNLMEFNEKDENGTVSGK